MGDIKCTLINLHANRGGLPVTGGQVLGDGNWNPAYDTVMEVSIYK